MVGVLGTRREVRSGRSEDGIASVDWQYQFPRDADRILSTRLFQQVVPGKDPFPAETDVG